MAASIAEYLLGLARDPAAAARHNGSAQAAQTMMSEAGLNQDQQDIIASRDPERITQAVQSELHAPAQGGLPFMMLFCIFAK